MVTVRGKWNYVLSPVAVLIMVIMMGLVVILVVTAKDETCHMCKSQLYYYKFVEMLRRDEKVSSLAHRHPLLNGP